MSGITRGCTWVSRDTVRVDVRVPVQIARGFALELRSLLEVCRELQTLSGWKRGSIIHGGRESVKAPISAPPAAPRCGSVGASGASRTGSHVIILEEYQHLLDRREEEVINRPGLDAGPSDHSAALAEHGCGGRSSLRFAADWREGGSAGKRKVTGEERAFRITSEQTVPFCERRLVTWAVARK